MTLNVYEWGEPSGRPLVCLHGVTSYGGRFDWLADSGRHVVSLDLLGHGHSSWEPPWDVDAHLAAILVSVPDGPAVWVGHSFGGRLVLELAARRPELLVCAVLLDPAIQILPHVGFDFAQEAAKDHAFRSADEAIEARLTSGSLTPRAALEEEAREHLTESPEGGLRWRYARAAVATMYSELCRQPPPPTALTAVPTLLVHAEQFGLVREDQLEEYPATLGDGLELVAVPGGHVVYWDAFEPTADAVETFLIRHSRVSQV